MALLDASGLYLISTEVFKLADYEQQEDVNALSGLYFISTLMYL